MQRLSEHRCFGGTQGFYQHDSAETRTPMRFALFTPPGEGPFALLTCLAGLTCTDENFTVKAGAQKLAAELGLMLLMPDTSPRGDDVPGDPDNAYDFGKGAGFYVDATQAPWSKHYRMRSYVSLELPAVVAAHFPADMRRRGILGHSMGGHGALTIALTMPGVFRSVSALAPICAPSQVPWGQKALGRYLGEDPSRWRRADAVALIEDGARVPELLVDQGEADAFLATQLRPELLGVACANAGIPLTLRRHPGYDHGYYFIASVIDDHLRWHAERLR
jgi:S-formylglutathione hydrolase